MIKKVLFGVFCFTQISLMSAANFNSNPDFSTNKEKENYQREKLPKSFIIKTKKFKIRIDLQPNGKYLYQSWGANSKITVKPSMIISNGELIADGSGGNYYYEFNNKEVTYQVWRNYLTNSPKKAPYTLKVDNEDGQTIVNQDAVIVKS